MAISKLTFLLFPSLLPGFFCATASPFSFPPSPRASTDHVTTSYPNRTIAGVTVIDTPVVRAAEARAREHASDFVYNHVMRGWLFGVLLWNHHLQLQIQERSNGHPNATTTPTADATEMGTHLDLEVHAVAALLHDLGWDRTPDSPIVSPDRRFEVDGAVASRDFLSEHRHRHAELAGERGRSVWDRRRTQLVWDAIALHTTASISRYKEAEVRVVGQGIMMDFQGPQLGVTEAEYAAVVARFPQTGLRSGVNETAVWLCASKPETTYDTFMQPFGENYVANYSAKGHRVFDTITGLPN
ncbi:hypothetical protein PG993_003590 [Apiospora rasikravindrae]|uniref:HD domain-containing protein n=1 Tax=Apiospora rasikravindrae TaxID=990691 RepID=A0ABR1U299_9PEZI